MKNQRINICISTNDQTIQKQLKNQYRMVWESELNEFVMIRKSMKRRSKIKERLTQRGYNSNLIEKQLLKVDELDRKETLKYRKKHKNKKWIEFP